MNRTELMQSISRVVADRGCSSVAIVGAPASGKTHFLREIRRHVGADSEKTVVYGPVTASTFLESDAFRTQFIEWLAFEGLLARQPDLEACLAAASQALFWSHIADCLNLRLKRVILVEIDEVCNNGRGPAPLYDLFTQLRKFCNEWQDDRLGVHFVSCGNWSRAELNTLCDRYMTSWPFVRNDSLFVLPDLTLDETRAWLSNKSGITGFRDLHSQYLWEITEGDNSMVSQILAGLEPGKLTCDRLYAEAERLVCSEAYRDQLRGQVEKLDQLGRQFLFTLLSGQFIDCQKHQHAWEQLLLTGLAREEQTEGLRFLRLKNWAIESALRHHWQSYSDLLQGSVYDQYKEFVPPITCLNRDAYGFICEIENLLRNLAVQRLYLYAGDKHPLASVFCSADSGKPIQSEYDRAAAWRTKTLGNPYVDTHLALTSYSQTKHLREWIDRLIDRFNDPLCTNLSTLRSDMSGFNDIRDAVTHNQIISETSYDTLLLIRNKLYRALVS